MFGGSVGRDERCSPFSPSSSPIGVTTINDSSAPLIATAQQRSVPSGPAPSDGAAGDRAPGDGGAGRSGQHRSGRTRRSSAPPRSGIFDGFDGLRAIAALLVIIVHSAFHAGENYRAVVGPFLARAEMGVAVFFVISGFLLYRPFVVAHLGGGPAPAAVPFLVRRFLRIYPAYWVALIVSLLVAHETIKVYGWQGLVRCMLLVQGFQPLWTLQGLTQAWTLTVEVGFYLSLPLYAWAINRFVRLRADPRSRLRIELGGVAVLFLAGKTLHRILIPVDSTDPRWVQGWPSWLPIWWDLFSLGMALAIVSAYYARLGRGPRWADLPGSGTACWLVAAGFYWVATTQVGLPVEPLYVVTVRTDMGRHLCYGLFGLFLVLPAVFGSTRRGWVRPFLASRPMALLGMISYGMYLWHNTVLELLQLRTNWDIPTVPYIPFLLLVVALTAVVATVTYHLVERPAIRLGRLLTRRGSALNPGTGPGSGPLNGTRVDANHHNAPAT